MIGDLSIGFQTRTVVWNFFKKIDETFANCNYCHGLFRYGTSRSHLLKHLRRKHPEVLLQFKKGIILPPVEISRTSSPEVEADKSETGDKGADETGDKGAHETGDKGADETGINVADETGDKGADETLDNGADEASSPDVWSIFSRLDSGIAKCNLCEVELSCKYSITDLTKHWKTEHLGVVLKCDPSENEPTRNGLCDITSEENCSSTPQISQVSSSNDAPARKVPPRPRKSPGWNYFTKVNKLLAECKICHLHINHQSISNLMRHVVRKHPGEIMARARTGKRKDSEEDSDSELQISDAEEEVEEEASEEANKIGKKAFHTRGSDESRELRSSKRMRTVKVEPEMDSMNESLQSSRDQEGFIIADDKRIDPNSYVWQVFTKLKKFFYQCKICGATIFQRSNMTSLLGHIKRMHPSFVSAMQKKLAESTKEVKKQPSEDSGHSRAVVPTPTEKAPTSDEEDAEPPMGGDVVSDSEPSDEAESGEPNQAGQNKQSVEASGPSNQSGGSKRSERNQKRRGKTKRVKSGKSKAKERRKSQSPCQLRERFTRAVEEGNLLMRELQEVVERQGRSLDRIVACLERLSEKKDA